MTRSLLLACLIAWTGAGEAPPPRPDGEPHAPWATETWPAARRLTWAAPGTSGELKDPAAWLEDGRPATAKPDQDTDLVLPASEQPYTVHCGGEAVRHVTVGAKAQLKGAHRREVEIWGNCEVAEGGWVYFVSIRGPRHSFFRLAGAAFPSAANKEDYRHVNNKCENPSRSQISHKFQVCKYGDASVEFIGSFGVSDEIMLQHGRLILDGHLRWSGVTGKGALEIYDGGILELRSGASAGPFDPTNGKGVYNLDIYRGGTLLAGSPERPLRRDAHLLLGFAENSRPGRTGLYAAQGSLIRVHSTDPAQARLVVMGHVGYPGFHNGHARPLEDQKAKAADSTGITLQLAGLADFSATRFDHVCLQGIRLADPAQRSAWKGVVFGDRCAGAGDQLFGPLTERPDVYYHARSDMASEFGLTKSAVRSMDAYLAKHDPWKLEFAPAATKAEEGKKGQDLDRPLPVPFKGRVEVTVRCAVPGAELRHTTDGSDPDSGSPILGGPLILTTSTLLKVRAYKPGQPPSAVASAWYRVER